MNPSVRMIGDTIDGDVLIAAAPDRVFEALISPVELMQWWGSSESYVIVSAEVDRREGGSWIIEAEDVGGRTFSINAIISRFDPPCELHLNWSTSWAPDNISSVEISLASEGDGTRLRLCHRGLGGSGTAGRDTHYWAWRSILGWAQTNLPQLA